ncbi:MAG: poly-beta-hydroxybutyrate polymerase N-terminal domain-containing protein, partial [Marinicaulis sp.]|nr:poly-beta-hydroxybutyrate polymerase N-terminal domain-containing protein [Marinicaulis sp.]
MADIKNIESYRDASKPPNDSGTAEKCPARMPTRHQNRMPISISPLQRWSKDSYSSTALFELADRSIDAMLGRYSLGLSPAALLDLYMDWSMGLAFAPGKRAQLVDKLARKNAKFLG